MVADMKNVPIYLLYILFSEVPVLSFICFLTLFSKTEF